ncbi:hypothetical protein DN051_01145 [Streptomyces cadmiisoli]|uniref:Uncharacterized protein n=1 Tax=Streptomyces cadmiisoli TaxID=2184053 RepID=A0A2Z4IRK3_9ACTN|nr:hypothetical protein [Streptomyces cadmiisoli]AWW35455.1 hypothetical protein DN051_01145 [Streptomyces cadmiisoli]
MCSEILGTAYSDHDLVVLLEAAGVADPENVRDDPGWVEWRGGRPHSGTTRYRHPAAQSCAAD